MIFFKKQHQDIAVGFLQRIDLMLRTENKSVLGYSIDEGVETLKLKVGTAIMELKIEGPAWSHNRPSIDEINPNEKAEQQIAETKEIIY